MKNSKKILLVDDEQDMIYAVRMRLEAEGYEVSVGTNGQEALNKIRIEKPDLIILDLMLPKIDGYKVCRMIKFDKKFAKIPIIICTARIQNEDIKLGFEVGADAYMTKPFDTAVLLNKIKELLNQ